MAAAWRTRVYTLLRQPAITHPIVARCSASSMLFASHSVSFDRAFRAAFGHGPRLRAARVLAVGA